MKTVAEIVIKMRGRGDFMGFQKGVLVEFLPLEDLKEFVGKDADISKMPPPTALTREAVLKQINSYMDFAWKKAGDHRGISASRSVIKMTAWIWLLGDEPIEAKYSQYGAPILAAICARYDLPVPQDVGVQNMITGSPCSAGCMEGCNS